ncbi:MAG: flagellar basal body-associated protein FliL [Bacillus sp. (in: firmicutes)]
MNRSNIWTQLLIVLVALTLAVIVFLAIFMNSNSVKIGSSQSTIDDVVKTSVEIPEITTNLADEGYIKISLTIQTNSKEAKKELEKRTFQVENTIITELSEIKAEQVMRKEGKSAIQKLLQDKINELMNTGKVEKVYITSAIIQ